MMRTALRRSAKARECDSCLGYIKRGAHYLASVASPNHDDIGNKKWIRFAECSACATRYGRAHLLVIANGGVS